MTEDEQIKRNEMAAGLRELADAIEDPKFPLLEGFSKTVSANIWDWTTKEDGERSYEILPEPSLVNLRKLVRGLGGKREKHYGTGGFTATRHFGPYVSVCVSAARDTVCKKVPTGNIIKHQAAYIPAYDEQEYEWECDEKILGVVYHDPLAVQVA